MSCLTSHPVVCRAAGAARTWHRGGSLCSFWSVRRLHHCGHRPASGSHHVCWRCEERHAQTCEFNQRTCSSLVIPCFTILRGVDLCNSSQCWPGKSVQILKVGGTQKGGHSAPDFFNLKTKSCVSAGTKHSHFPMIKKKRMFIKNIWNTAIL